MNAVGTDSREVHDGVVLDFGADGLLVGIDIDHASKVLNLESVQIVSLPARFGALGKA